MIIPAAADPVFIIAELSGNHGGSKQRAIDLIHAAKAAGADAVKLHRAPVPHHFALAALDLRPSHLS